MLRFSQSQINLMRNVKWCVRTDVSNNFSHLSSRKYAKWIFNCTNVLSSSHPEYYKNWMALHFAAHLSTHTHAFRRKIRLVNPNSISIEKRTRRVWEIAKGRERDRVSTVNGKEKSTHIWCFNCHLSYCSWLSHLKSSQITYIKLCHC